MTTSRITAGYVITDRGEYLVQFPDENRWGFVLADDDQSWPGGIGVAKSWQFVAVEDVPVEDVERLDWLFEEVS